MSVLTKVAHTVRALSADAVEQATCGHPGLPLGCAEIGTVLFGKVMRHDPHDPQWPDRDRFVLSAGHGSMLLYALLHVSGYELPKSEIERFRQLGSITPGHPEWGLTPGVETTTGPLGQGFGNGVGMALAEALLAARFNRPGHTVVDHYTYVLASDGDLMEGVASEAASLAAHLRLGKLIVVYDHNEISIEGSTDLAFTEDVGRRFAAYGWAVQTIDGHDLDAVEGALRQAREETDKPSLIVARTHIGRYSPKQDSADVHGAALGADAVAALKDAIGFPQEPFHVPDEAYAFFRGEQSRWTDARKEWQSRFASWSEAHPDLRRAWDAGLALALPDDLEATVLGLDLGEEAATRKSSGRVLQTVAKALPYLIGGSADLAPSNNSLVEGEKSVQPGRFDGRNLHFGVREHAMGSICNGLALHGGVRPYAATFLAFSDYMRPPIRLAALMKLPVIYIFTHDSIYLGEDGPTHQPIEQLEALRAIPNLHVIRPAHPQEVALGWLSALQRTDGPTALILTRQTIPALAGGQVDPDGFGRGGYIVRPERSGTAPELVWIATGSEVATACEAAAKLEDEGRSVRVVSVPCREVFFDQPEAYREEVLGGPSCRRITLEAGVGQGWYRLTRPGDLVYGLERFGESAPGEVVAEHLGFSVDAMLDTARRLL